MNQELRSLARLFAAAAREPPGAVDDDGFTEEERAGGALLDALAQEISPALREANTNISFGEPLRDFTLTKDARFLHWEAGKPWPVRHSAMLLRVEGDVHSILDDLEEDLLAEERPSCAQAAAVVEEVRTAIDEELSGVGSIPAQPAGAPR